MFYTSSQQCWNRACSFIRTFSRIDAKWSNWLVGARVTATDQSGSLENLRRNLHQNTRGIQRHQPQVTALTFDLDQHHSKCHYDYVLAAEVLYHHDCFAKLLVTMKHFCRPGTNLIWAIKVRDPSDLVFIEDFNKAFHATMLAELDGVRIYLATHRAKDNEDPLTESEEGMEKWHTRRNCTEEENLKSQKTLNSEFYGVDIKNDGHCEQAVIQHQEMERGDHSGGNDMESGKWEESQDHSESESFPAGNIQDIIPTCYAMFIFINNILATFSDDSEDSQLSCQKIWESKYSYLPGKEVHYFMGHKIIIEESLDSYGAMIWPAVSVD